MYIFLYILNKESPKNKLFTCINFALTLNFAHRGTLMTAQILTGAPKSCDFARPIYM